MRVEAGVSLPFLSLFVDGRARVQSERVDRDEALRALRVEEELSHVRGAGSERLLRFAGMAHDDVRPEGDIELAAPLRDRHHLVEVTLEAPRLAYASDLRRIAGF